MWIKGKWKKKMEKKIETEREKRRGGDEKNWINKSRTGKKKGGKKEGQKEGREERRRGVEEKDGGKRNKLSALKI